MHPNEDEMSEFDKLKTENLSLRCDLAMYVKQHSSQAYRILDLQKTNRHLRRAVRALLDIIENK